MKKLLSFCKNNIKVVAALLVGGLLAGGSVYAATVIASSSISYNNSKSGLSSTNLQDALDEAYNSCKYNCPDGYKCLPALCRRATKLNTETCIQTSTTNFCGGYGYAEGETITYGSLGTRGVLTTGDAFDCDVDGDGTYSDTERFYYVTDLDSTTAGLIYYNNVASGVATSSDTDAWCKYGTGGVTTYGPSAAIS